MKSLSNITRAAAPEAGPARAAVIDIGSSHVRLVLGERRADRLHVLETLRLPVPIGADVFRRGSVTPAAASQLVAALERFRTVLEGYAATETWAVATTALREARNRDVLLDWLRRRCGFAVRVLTPGDVVYYYDAYLYFRMSDQLPVRSRNILTADIGAGSADFSLLRRGAVVATAGLPLGTLRLSRLLERTRAEPSSAADALREYAATGLANLRRQLPRIAPDDIVLFSDTLAAAVAGVLGLKQPVPAIVRFDRRAVEDLWQRCRGRSPAELAALYGLADDVAATLVANGAMVAALLAVFELSRLAIVQTSLGEALLTYELFQLGRAERYDTLRQQLSVARSLCYRHGVDVRHPRRVALFARRLFDGLAAHLGLEPTDLNYLLIAAWLHDIGKSIALSAHHKHSEYLISALSLFRLDQEEVRLIACVARYHRRSVPRLNHPLFASLAQPARVKVQKLAALLRLADALDRSQTGRVADIGVRLLADGTAEVRVRAEDEPLLERLAFDEKKDLYCEITGSDVRLVVNGTG